ncbi:MAG TPA: amidohydrolase family protein [Rummeliibacillus sp.]|nr:amidohydrolase family protein [Rummeliibacillus sp.]
MTQSLLIQNVIIVNNDELKENLDVYIENGKIKKIGSQLNFTADEKIDGSNHYLFPGYIDMHIHGSAGKDTMDATPESLHTIAQSLVKEGTTSYLATTMTQSSREIEAALSNLAVFKSAENEAEIIGVHIEGPFISKKCAGAQPLQHIVPPTIEQFEHWQQLSGNRIKEITVAPEVEGGFEFVEALAKQGIVVSIGHSDATFEDMQKAVSLGAKQGTHLYNQMRPSITASQE